MTDTLHNVSRSALPLTLAAVLLGGCTPRRIDLVSGSYRADIGNKTGETPELSWKPTATLVVDMDTELLTIETGGTTRAFTISDQGSQGTGECAGELDAQWATVEGGKPVIDGVTFEAPLIFSQCGSPSPAVYLGEGPAVPQYFSTTSTWLGFKIVR